MDSLIEISRLILRGYIDESYNEKLFTLSCLLTKPSCWLWIESDWKRAIKDKNRQLAKEGRLQIKRFHATDCSNRKGEYKDWTSEEQIAFVKRILWTLKKQPCTVVAYSILREDYEAVFPEDFPDQLPHLYGLLLKFLLTELASQLKDLGRKGEIKVVAFEFLYDRSRCGFHVEAAFDQMKRDPTFTYKDHFLSINSVGWEDCIALQAADLVAYELFKDATGNEIGRKRRRSLSDLLASPNFGGRARLIRKKNLQKLRDLMEGRANGEVVLDDE